MTGRLLGPTICLPHKSGGIPLSAFHAEFWAMINLQQFDFVDRNLLIFIFHASKIINYQICLLALEPNILHFMR